MLRIIIRQNKQTNKQTKRNPETERLAFYKSTDLKTGLVVVDTPRHCNERMRYMSEAYSGTQSRPKSPKVAQSRLKSPKVA